MMLTGKTPFAKFPKEKGENQAVTTKRLRDPGNRAENWKELELERRNSSKLFVLDKVVASRSFLSTKTTFSEERKLL